MENTQLDYEIKKANIWLNTDWEEVLGKSRPTEKDKNSHIDLVLDTLKREVTEAEIEYNYVRRLVKTKQIQMQMEAKE